MSLTCLSCSEILCAMRAESLLVDKNSGLNTSLPPEIVVRVV